MRERRIAAAIGALALIASAEASAGERHIVARDVDDADWRRLERGDVVLHSKRVVGFPWPEVMAWRRVAATPTEVMAVYTDFDTQSSYIPEIVTSRVVAREAPDTIRVFYEYELPGPNERYTVAVTVRRTMQGFEARWMLVSARYARRLDGEIEVEPFGSATLIRYSSRVDPGVIGTTFGDPESVARRLHATVDALAARVERLKASEPEWLERLVRGLSSMVGGEP